ncbi:riboflavin synthase [Allostreptomyces psammosilenae]|uniref:Riboflavin synthase n=1 Tax=Allostreptomyces psammosilenae TaxID=1892865 RepID=A0A852ZS06_9ACTN|nr:riboflavin synthase [Allostreptomyces psammosilenae]NYI04247.1 riboflavin synthase [Allostreptomyces psammosilenae]
MFTGIVEELGEVVGVERLDSAARIRLRGRTVTVQARHGDSIAVNGVCLTVVDVPGTAGLAPDEFTADVMAETLHRSNLGDLTAGTPVNLERATAVGARLGGHIVQGHVDGTAELLARTSGPLDAAGAPRWEVLRFSLPARLARYVVEKGSITVDGVSLTVVEAGHDSFTVSLIPTTLALTTLGRRAVGERVNLEVDVLAKYLERLVAVEPEIAGRRLRDVPADGGHAPAAGEPADLPAGR